MSNRLRASNDILGCCSEANPLVISVRGGERSSECDRQIEGIDVDEDEGGEVKNSMVDVTNSKPFPKIHVSTKENSSKCKRRYGMSGVICCWFASEQIWREEKILKITEKLWINSRDKIQSKTKTKLTNKQHTFALPLNFPVEHRLFIVFRRFSLVICQFGQHLLLSAETTPRRPTAESRLKRFVFRGALVEHHPKRMVVKWAWSKSHAFSLSICSKYRWTSEWGPFIGESFISFGILSNLFDDKFPPSEEDC